MSDPKYLVGQLLLSMPGIGDERFARAVIAMCVHDDDGALGIIVNAPLNGLRVHQLMAQLEVERGVTPDVPVHAGGPVEPGRGFVLHSTEWSGQSTIDVAGRYALTSTLDVLKAIAAGTGPKHWLSALGYTGWAAGQLDEELTRHGWHACAGDSRLVFDTPAAHMWHKAFIMEGLDVGRISASAGRA